MKLLIYVLLLIAPLNIFCQKIKGIGIWEQLILETNKLVTSDSCSNNTYVIEKKVKSITEVSLDSEQPDTNLTVVFIEKYNKNGLLTDFISKFEEIKYTYDSTKCTYNKMYLKKPIGIFEPEGEIGSIRGKECICKEYSGKGLLIDYSIERNNFNESWHYEY